MFNNNNNIYIILCVYICGPWVFSDTVAVFIVRRVVGKQIGSVTQVKRNGDGSGSGKKHTHTPPGDSTDCKHSHTPSQAHRGDIN